jgi:alpha-D-xyloside xylohydrolase
MKFTDGYWLVRDGVKILHPRQAYRVDATAETLTVLAPTRRIESRGDVLNTPALTIECSSPLPDVIRVKLVHHAGAVDRGPHFALPGAEAAASTPPPVLITDDPSAASLTSGRLTVRFPRQGEWRVEFLADGEPLTASQSKGMATTTSTSSCR